LSKELKKVSRERYRRRSRRRKKDLPVLSLVGYTNAGKSTLLNSLTNSSITAEDKLFATLDPTSRRLRFPEDREVIITDTVGFIHDLPKELIVAFRATLEELESADLLLHVIDISNPRHLEQVRSVERILNDLHLFHLPQVRALNKTDRLAPSQVAQSEERLGGIPICARNQASLRPLIQKLTAMVENHRSGSL